VPSSAVGRKGSWITVNSSAKKGGSGERGKGTRMASPYLAIEEKRRDAFVGIVLGGEIKYRGEKEGIFSSRLVAPGGREKRNGPMSQRFFFGRDSI